MGEIDALARAFETMTRQLVDQRERLVQAEREGATEVVYQPAGPGIPRELERFLLAATR
jgi:5,10-methylenetetrahydromethanopterin reductase